MGQGIAGYVAQSNVFVNLADARKVAARPQRLVRARPPRRVPCSQFARFDPSVDDIDGIRTKSCVCMPVRDQTNQTIAVVMAINRQMPNPAS
jgi:hypothetical protein